ncbi:hypothetical protein [Rhodococcus sp. ARC_M6]|uniref:hypothetical protein n=1 Tax=Rhodococcus sp. ARC_M6 TaxID=2928852 RepID=UPI001FB48E51|nr:hypothetical protein [Rhodococcus sp. ARC_M6]MCJ0906202.1 hypothetical protein [Rhodococcus sp. ARC_M6]
MNRSNIVSSPTDKLSTSENLREAAAVFAILATTYAVVYGVLKALVALGWCA